MTPEQSRSLCTPEDPMTPDRDHGQRWEHRDTEEVGDQMDGWPGGDVVTVRCKACGTTWREELPQ